MNLEGGWNYRQVCDVINELKQAGFDAGVTVGGVWVDAPEGDEIVLAIARRYGGESSCGETTLMWMTTEG